MAESINLAPQKILSVSELNYLARQLLEMNFPLFWVSGEVSNFVRAASGHWYFSLKDSGAQVRCVMFKGRNSYVDFTPREGDKIEARATVTLYEARGDFQLTVEFVQKAGLGVLFEAFERLKLKLQAAGLFAVERKKKLPTFPKKIGIVTSSDAAALRDVLATLKRRNPAIAIVIYPTPVQGKGAALKVAEAINTASRRKECDVLIICRGGGSLEDLWQFNEEVVALAIADCLVPTISGVGHETDFTISDFVADVRAATPTAAAELACQDAAKLLQQLEQLSKQLSRSMMLHLQARAQTLDYLARQLISPLSKLATQKGHIVQLQNRLNYSMQQQLIRQQQQLKQLKSSIEKLSPNAILMRGYAIITEQQRTISDVSQLEIGQEIQVQLYKSKFHARVTKK